MSFFSQAHDTKTDKVGNKMLPKISVQLWSVKNELKSDFKIEA